MRALRFARTGDPAVLRVNDVPARRPPVRDVLVAVRASSVNGTDLGLRRGDLPVATLGRLLFVMGFDVAGDVLACGPQVTAFVPGDRVMAWLALRSNASTTACAATAATAGSTFHTTSNKRPASGTGRSRWVWASPSSPHKVMARPGRRVSTTATASAGRRCATGARPGASPAQRGARGRRTARWCRSHLPGPGTGGTCKSGLELQRRSKSESWTARMPDAGMRVTSAWPMLNAIELSVDRRSHLGTCRTAHHLGQPRHGGRACAE